MIGYGSLKGVAEYHINDSANDRQIDMKTRRTFCENLGRRVVDVVINGRPTNKTTAVKVQNLSNMKPLACVSMGLVLTGSVLGQAPLKVTIADAWGSSHTNFGNTEKYAYEFRLGSDIKRVPYQVSAGPDANVIFDGVNENDVDNLIVTLAAPTIVDPVDGNISYTSVVGFNLVVSIPYVIHIGARLPTQTPGRRPKVVP